MDYNLTTIVPVIASKAGNNPFLMKSIKQGSF